MSERTKDSKSLRKPELQEFALFFLSGKSRWYREGGCLSFLRHRYLGYILLWRIYAGHRRQRLDRKWTVCRPLAHDDYIYALGRGSRVPVTETRGFAEHAHIRVSIRKLVGIIKWCSISPQCWCRQSWMTLIAPVRSPVASPNIEYFSLRQFALRKRIKGFPTCRHRSPRNRVAPGVESR